MGIVKDLGMSNSIIIVPYRNRTAHLAQFLSHMAIHYSQLHICVVEQEEGKQFNRAKLLNVGYLENRTGFDTYVMHDVDMLPGINVDYYNSPFYMTVEQLVTSEIQKIDYLGGVTKFKQEAFYRSGGYHNEYFHRAEDNEMRFNLRRLGINVIEKPQPFTMLNHERKGPEFDPVLWKKAQKKRIVQNQLSVCEYKIIDAKTFDNVRHIICEI